MATKLYDLAVIVGKKKDKNGQDAPRWKNIGSMFENDKGKFLTLEASFNPAGVERQQGSDSIVISLFPPKDKDKSKSSQPKQQPTPQPQPQDNQTTAPNEWGFSFDNVPF